MSGSTLDFVLMMQCEERGGMTNTLGFQWFSWPFWENRRPKTVRVAFLGGGAIYLSCQKWGGCGNGYGRTCCRCWAWRLSAVMPSVGNGYGGLSALRSRFGDMVGGWRTNGGRFRFVHWRRYTLVRAWEFWLRWTNGVHVRVVATDSVLRCRRSRCNGGFARKMGNPQKTKP